MKRGFLNSKKAKGKPLYSGASTGSSAPPKQLPPLGDVTAVSPPKELPEPAFGYDFLERVSASTLEPHAIVRFPSLTLTKSKEPSSICILRTSTLKSITNTKGFYTALPPQNPADVITTINTPDMGVGLFAKRNFKVNDVILSERALLVCPSALPLLDKEEAKKYPHAFGKEDVDSFMSLSNCNPNFAQAHGIANTNAFDTDIDEENRLRGQFGYSAIGRFTSRINHSCSPNVGVDFDIPTFSLQIIARRDIEAGQQLFYCYRGLKRPVKERRRQLLESYGFVCQCKACANATPESDKLRGEVHDRIDKFSDGLEEMFADPRFNIRSLDPLLKLEKEMVKEGLDFGDYFTILLFTIMQAYKKLNNTPKESEYLAKWIKYYK